jgi:hypothetical protein
VSTIVKTALLRRIVPYLIVVFGFAIRVHAIDATWIDGDRANPHGVALQMVDQLSRGEFTDRLLFSDDSSIGLPNGPVVTYIWVAVSLFDRSLWVATAFGLLANALAVAVVYALGRRCYGWTTGALAAALLAGSNWGMYLARGMWHPGQLEISVAVVACLLAIGVQRRRPWPLLWGFIAAGLTAGQYFAALLVPFQSAVATAFAGGWRPPLRRTWLAGLGVCLAGLVAIVLSMTLTGRLTADSFTRISLLNSDGGGLTPTQLQARDITPFNRDPVGHFLRLVTNRDYAQVWTDPGMLAFGVREPLTQVLAALLSVFVVAGLLRMALHWREPVNRFLLFWAALPIVALLAIAALKSDFRIPVYYLLLAAPVGYIAAGYGGTSALRAARAGPALTAAICAALIALPACNAIAAAETVQKQAFIQVDFIPLKWARQLGDLWRRECTLVNGSNFGWDLSLIQSPERWRRGGTSYNEMSSIWTFPIEGGACALKQAGAPLPHAELLPLALDDGTIVRTYRAQPYDVPSEIQATVNLGWSLLEFSVPKHARTGETVHVRHAWRVDALPDEPHTNWYFGPFIKLIALDGTVVVDIDDAVALEGWQWRPGEVQVSEVELALPGDLAPGTYRVESSLFDPNQKKNAVYFRTADPATPILTLEHAMEVQP